MIASRLSYVALVVNGVDALATALSRHFGLVRRDVAIADTGRIAPMFAVGTSALALFETGDPFVDGQAKAGVHHIALEAPDVVAAAGHAVTVGITPADREPTRGVGGARRVLLSPAATAGVRMYLTEPIERGPAGGGWVERFDHVGVASADNAAAIDAFVTRLGFEVESTQTDMEVTVAIESFTSDKYGAAYHTRPPQPAGGLRVTFIAIGDCELEFLQEFDPAHGAHVSHGVPGTTKQDQGAVGRYIASRGAGLHHIALKVTDIDRALAELAKAGLDVIDRVGRPGSRRARIGFIHPKSLGGILVHLVERQPF
jgi:catechol 2,3-dioxygenase-like lactoylglutathione lyase family enzyme